MYICIVFTLCIVCILYQVKVNLNVSIINFQYFMKPKRLVGYMYVSRYI